MPEYHRAKIAGGTSFFTVVTDYRLSILSDKVERSKPGKARAGEAVTDCCD
jgi:hypothetical protein